MHANPRENDETGRHATGFGAFAGLEGGDLSGSQCSCSISEGDLVL